MLYSFTGPRENCQTNVQSISFTIYIYKYLMCRSFVEIESPRAFVEIESPLAMAFVAFYSMINYIVIFCVTMVMCYN